MTQIWWWIVEPVSRLLEHDEREAVLGDLEEARQTGPRALLDVLDVLIRRQARFWMEWHPWLIFLGLILPIGMLLSILSRQTSGGSAVYLWMYANNWDAALTQNPGFWRLFVETAAWVVISYLTLACLSWTGGFVLGSLSRAMSALSSLLLCLILFLGEIIGAPTYLDFFHDKAFGALDLPDVHAAIFEVSFYRVILPVIVQILLVAIPALWGFHIATRMGKLKRLVSILLWVAAIATLALASMPDLSFWFSLAAHILHINAPAGIWSGIRALEYLRPLEFWPIVFLIVHAVTRHRLIRTPA
jgi:hypothetical protein